MPRLAGEGTTLRVAVRHPDGRAVPCAQLDWVGVFCADVPRPSRRRRRRCGAGAVVNAVSAYVERGGVTVEAGRPVQRLGIPDGLKPGDLDM